MNTTYDRPQLYKLAEKAALTLKLKDGVYTLLRHLIHRIPEGAAYPISPASPGELAAMLRISERAIRSRVSKLLDLGLVRDARLANGRRCVERDSNGGIIAIAGLDLTPLLEHAAELAERDAAMKADRREHRRLRCDISRRRGDLKTEIARPDTPKEAIELWSGLPRRLAELSLDALHQLVDKLDQLVVLLRRGRKKTSDQPEGNDRQYFTKYTQSKPSKLPASVRNADESEARGSGSGEPSRQEGWTGSPRKICKEKAAQKRTVSPQNDERADGRSNRSGKTGAGTACEDSGPTREQVARFFKAHPRPGNEKEAEDAFIQIVRSGENPETLIARAEAYGASVRKSGTESVYGATNWLLKGIHLKQNIPLEMSPEQRAEASDKVLSNWANMIKQRMSSCGSISPDTVVELLRRGLVTREDCRGAGIPVPAYYVDAPAIGGLEDA